MGEESQRKKTTRVVELLGWLTESSIMPKRQQAIAVVGPSFILELKAQLYKSQDESKKTKELSGPDVHFHRAKKILPAPNLFSAKNSGIDACALKLSSMAANSVVKPRVLIVSRRTVRKNKFVDFVGEYHLDLIVGYGAVPVIVPRVSGVDKLLESFEPIHGVLLCEGEDIDPSLYENETYSLSSEELEEIKKSHASDTAIDKEKDLVELELVKLCLERNIPYLGICRGSQILNVACGGTLYQDIDTEISKEFPDGHNVSHINYEDYDGHRHVIKVVDGTPLHHWFKDSLEKESLEILVNSYHHQGVKRLAQRFVPMAFSPDGLVEGFYDPNAYNPKEGKFIVGLQFHPERMRLENSQEFDYPGCSSTYQEFVKAVIFYQKKLESFVCVPRPLLFTREVEKKRKLIGRSLSLTRDRYTSGCGLDPLKESEHETEFLKYDTSSFSTQQELRLMEMGATVRNSAFYYDILNLKKKKEMVARNVMGKMSVQQLGTLLSFHRMMGLICQEMLETKLHGNATEF